VCKTQGSECCLERVAWPMLESQGQAKQHQAEARAGLRCASWWSSRFLALVRIDEGSGSLPVHSSGENWVWVVVAHKITGTGRHDVQGSSVSFSLETAPMYHRWWWVSSAMLMPSRRFRCRISFPRHRADRLLLALALDVLPPQSVALGRFVIPPHSVRRELLNAINFHCSVFCCDWALRVLETQVSSWYPLTQWQARLGSHLLEEHRPISAPPPSHGTVIFSVQTKLRTILVWDDRNHCGAQQICADTCQSVYLSRALEFGSRFYLCFPHPCRFPLNPRRQSTRQMSHQEPNHGTHSEPVISGRGSHPPQDLQG
jgi:hypothetical protein